MNYIVGSGPSGIATAVALLKRGLKVTLLDSGLELEQNRQETVQRLSKQSKEDWASADVDLIKGKTSATTKGIPLKFCYGSDFHYRETDALIGAEGKNFVDFELLSSMAKGGLSNVWGAAILPYTQSELSSWPIGTEELAPHYREVLGFMPISGSKDELERFYPLHAEPSPSLKLSRQASLFLEKMEKNKLELGRAGIYFGRSRLAVHNLSNTISPCSYCGLCLYGCPYALIYSTQQTLAHLIKNPNFTYLSQILVERFTETAGEVRIHCFSKSDGKNREFVGEKLFLGSGLVSTAKIVLTSLEQYNRSIPFHASQHFILPLMRKESVKDVSSEALHTLSQLFIELMQTKHSSSPIHLQVYSYSDMYKTALKSLLGFAYPIASSTLDGIVLGRLLILQGYLNSELSSELSLTLNAPGSGNTPAFLAIQSRQNPKTADTIKEILEILKSQGGNLGAHAIGQMLKVSLPGGGAHSGGTFPMRIKPKELETDSIGRLSGFQKVHLVDSSVFPNVPASTITFTVMANAHRIGTLAC